MIEAIVDGQRMQIAFDMPAPGPTTRAVSSAGFLALWTPAEVQATSSADPRLFYAMIRATAQGTVNLNSPDLATLLVLAVSKGALTDARAQQILAGVTAPIA